MHCAFPASFLGKIPNTPKLLPMSGKKFTWAVLKLWDLCLYICDPCTPPSNGHAFNMYWRYRMYVHVQQTLNYTNLTTAPKCKKPNLNLCMCAGVGVWVLLKSPFCVKHPIFTNISWDFDDLSTKTRHAPYNVWSSKYPPAGCTFSSVVSPF